MEANTPLAKTLCLKYCSYFKPGKSEELACRGYYVVERLMHAGRIRNLETSGVSVNVEIVRDLVRALCNACPFHEHDCDFFQDRASQPCGGFVLLSQLLAGEDITINEIKCKNGG